eukprot:gene15657-23901_t
MDIRQSISPNPRRFDVVDARQVSPTPPPPPAPYSPIIVRGGADSLGGIDSDELSPAHGRRALLLELALPAHSPPTQGMPPQAPASPLKTAELGERAARFEAREEKMKYVALQADLKRKFEKIQDEYRGLEAELRADCAERVIRAMAGGETGTADHARKDAELRQLHRMLETQHNLMQEQLRSVEQREADLAAKEAALLRTDDPPPLDDPSAPSPSDRERQLEIRERTVADRELTAARLERQLRGLQRMRKAAAADAACQAGGAAAAADAAAQTEDEGGVDLQGAAERHEAAAQQLGHAEAMWAAAQRKEKMLGDWEEGLAEREKEVISAVEGRKYLKEAAVALMQAACLAESRVTNELDERLVRRLHQRERLTLLRSEDAAAQSLAEQKKALESWEHELELSRTNLHQTALLVRNKVLQLTPDGNDPTLRHLLGRFDDFPDRGGSAATGISMEGSLALVSAKNPGDRVAEVKYTPALEEELRAREQALLDREAQWSVFLNREVHAHGSLEAQRFDANERLREVERREAEMEEKQRRLNEDVVRVGEREIAAQRAEDEAAKVLARLDNLHCQRQRVEQREKRAEGEAAAVAAKARQVQRERDRLEERGQLLRDREKRLEHRLTLEAQGHRRLPAKDPPPGEALVPRSPLSPITLFPTTPANALLAAKPQKPPKSGNLEEAVYSFTSMLDSLAAKATP